MRLDDIFPTVPPVRRLLATAPDLENEGLDFWIWFRSLQGLVNRAEPHLYLIKGGEVYKQGRDYWERHWLDYYTNPDTSPFKIPLQRQNSVDAIVERFRDRVNGYILYDMADVPQTMNLAITLAGLNDCLPVAADQEPWMVRHGIPKRDDLRGRFSNDWQAAEWAVDNLWPQCN
ncbi:MAG TPA: GxGYxYP family putative glycoside hydrolase, partial [Candidatus Latescibacteria bacterium]|nr:GxGYxYP family putative glycoside hydrolase [Candidatus Latescibacterota bacterium]